MIVIINSIIAIPLFYSLALPVSFEIVALVFTIVTIIFSLKKLKKENLDIINKFKIIYSVISIVLIFGMTAYNLYNQSNKKVIINKFNKSVVAVNLFGQKSNFITIPDSVTCIRESAFYNCSCLTDITYNGTISQWNSIDKDSYWNYNTGNYIVHCTDGDISK